MDKYTGRKLRVLASWSLLCVVLLLIVKTGYADQQSLGQKIFKRGDYTVHLGFAGANQHKLPVGFDTDCRSNWFCGLGVRVGVVQSKPVRGSLRTDVLRLAADNHPYDSFSFSSVVASKGIGFDINKNRYIGLSGDASVGAGLTLLSVNSDNAITPVAELALSISASISRLVLTLGAHYRQAIPVKVDDHRYGPASRGGHLSFGFSF